MAGARADESVHLAPNHRARAARPSGSGGGCGPLSLCECAHSHPQAQAIDAAMAFAEALALHSAATLQFDFGDEVKLDLAPYIRRLLAWPHVRELWLQSPAWPPLRSWKHVVPGHALKILHTYTHGKACKRPPTRSPPASTVRRRPSPLSPSPKPPARGALAPRCANFDTLPPPPHSRVWPPRRRRQQRCLPHALQEPGPTGSKARRLSST